MTSNSTFLDVMRDAADFAGDERGVRFYRNPTDATFASYADLDRRARTDAAALAAAGHAPGEVVVLAFEPGLEFIRALYALFYAGLVASPVSVAAMRQPEIARRRLEAIVVDAGSRLVLTHGSALQSLALGEGDTLDVYSPESAMGSAINGKSKGDKVSYTAPNGKELSVTIVDAE